MIDSDVEVGESGIEGRGVFARRGMTGESFFALPRDLQREYLPYRADWFTARHAEAIAEPR
jgi:hypothetical protein